MSFTIVNGQIYTPGLAIIDAPQPYTPLGGDNLQVSIDVSGNGRLSLPADEDDDDDAPTKFHNITIFLTSTENERNLTISNGTLPSDSDSNTGYVGPVLDLEPGSTVKHVNWVWPRCFVGSGSADSTNGEDGKNWRGEWNITLHQAFRWEGEEYYTVFELPISVTNGIEDDEMRVACEALENRFDMESLVVDGGLAAGEPWVGEDGTDNDSDEDGDGDRDEGNGAVGLRTGGGLRFWERVALVILVVVVVL
ncbi:hypothetical protein BDW75DRAFT_225472 [Aspergillus navahoensis]